MENLSPENHVKRITKETYNLLKNIIMAFTYLDEEIIKKKDCISDLPKVGICQSAMNVVQVEGYKKD